MSVRLRDTVGPDAVLARFGGDEFIVVVDGVVGREPDEPGSIPSPSPSGCARPSAGPSSSRAPSCS